MTRFCALTFFLFWGSLCYGQVTVTGIVRDKFDKVLLPGINVFVKGTSLGTVTNVAGEFSIQVPDLNQTLVFSFLGYTTMEIALNGRSNIEVFMSADGIIDYFDAQMITVRPMFGIKNKLFGGEISATAPVFYKHLTLKGSVGHLNDFDNTKMTTAYVALDHIIVKWRFQQDVRVTYRNLHYDSFHFRTVGVRTDLNFRPITFIVGYVDADNNLQRLGGGTFGVTKWINPIRSIITLNMNVYKGMQEYEGEIFSRPFRAKPWRSIQPFLRYYRIKNFDEFMVGLNWDFWY